MTFVLLLRLGVVCRHPRIVRLGGSDSRTSCITVIFVVLRLRFTAWNRLRTRQMLRCREALHITMPMIFLGCRIEFSDVKLVMGLSRRRRILAVMTKLKLALSRVMLVRLSRISARPLSVHLVPSEVVRDRSDVDILMLMMWSLGRCSVQHVVRPAL